MKKSIITLGIAAFVLSTGIASADMAFRTHSDAYHPMFGTGIGGGFGGIHNVDTGVVNAAAVQETAKEWSKNDNNTESDVVIKTESKKVPEFVPTSTNLGEGEGFAYEKGKDGYVYGYATGGKQGVNDTKTMYTDGIGRIHFFGKKNKVSE